MGAGEVGLSVRGATMIRTDKPAPKEFGFGFTCPVCFQLELGGHEDLLVCESCGLGAHLVRRWKQSIAFLLVLDHDLAWG